VINAKIKALLATPKIKDPYFHKTIILMTGEQSGYYHGLILNKTMNERIMDIWEDVNPNLILKNNKNLRNGGPLYGAIAVVHKIKKYSEQELFSKNYISIHPENIEKIIQNKTKPFEMYVGYCGWSSAQLATELAVGSWWPIEPDETMIFGDNYDYWKLKKEEQNKFYLDKLGIKIQNHILN
jgi:putative AlgH/UPF0301 family transcriptional regulator